MIQLSVGASTEKELGILNLGSGVVKINSTIFKKGYCPGKIPHFYLIYLTDQD